jgi:hypothetical protein
MPKNAILSAQCKKSTVYLLPDDSIIASFIVGEMSSFNGNPIRKVCKWKIEYFRNCAWSRTKEHIPNEEVVAFKQHQKNQMQFGLTSKTFRELTSTNDLEPGDYTITHLGTMLYRNVERTIYKLAEKPNIAFVDNHWFAREIAQVGSKQMHLRLKVEDTLKTTPTKVKQRVVYIKQDVLMERCYRHHRHHQSFQCPRTPKEHSSKAAGLAGSRGLHS